MLKDMKLEARALIIGNFTLSAPLKASYRGYEVAIFIENESYYISVTKRVTDYQPYITKYHKEDKSFQLTDCEIYNDLIDYLQYIESAGAFNLEIEKVIWQEPIISWVPENEAEMGIMPILSHQKLFQKQRKPKLLQWDNIHNLVIYKNRIENLVIPFQYFRIARNYFNDHQYYFAIINFYMLLEYCFANGKFQKRATLAEFNNSDLLNKAIIKSISHIQLDDSFLHHRQWLENECKMREKNFDVHGINCLIVEYRGLLSHASVRSKQYLFEDEKLRSLAFFMLSICFSVCGLMQIGAFTNEEGRKKLYKITEN